MIPFSLALSHCQDLLIYNHIPGNQSRCAAYVTAAMSSEHDRYQSSLYGLIQTNKQKRQTDLYSMAKYAVFCWGFKCSVTIKLQDCTAYFTIFLQSKGSTSSPGHYWHKWIFLTTHFSIPWHISPPSSFPLPCSLLHASLSNWLVNGRSVMIQKKSILDT